jgi:hypothetical protein
MNKEQRIKELQELYRQFIMDKLGVDVNNQLGRIHEQTKDIYPTNT